MGHGAADMTAGGKIELQSRETAVAIRSSCKGDADLLPPAE